ncbi:hypothetical protein JG688_00013784 [Phytophthora aleatoria]|uniref:Protein kinase domain-containing protein n=1 Tax=Phytophthora aleatoria TaxID=2496075 RepID=A0A8J5I8H5_9STRA|nr:hypothetical protein JG688_00013784 [Phytophthora aleatoria]
MQTSKRCGLASFENAVLPSTDSFYAWDGTNSDLARQLYFRAKAGDAVSPYNNFKVPSAVQGRLEDLELAWDKLPGIAQRALLWDSGFGVSPTNEPVKMWTLNGHSMADLAVPLAHNEQCTGADILKTARCVVEGFSDDSNVNTAMWVTGGRPEVIPALTIRKHTWKDGGDNNSYIDYGRIASSSSGEFNMLFLIPIVVVVALAFAGIFLIIKRRRSKNAEHYLVEENVATPNAAYQRCYDGDPSQYNSGKYNSEQGLHTDVTVDDSDTTSRRFGSGVQARRSSRYTIDYISGSNLTMKILLDNEHLIGMRIPYDGLTFTRALSKGDYEITRRRRWKRFAKEIELTARLAHPNIVSFVGVAWNTLTNLVMALEFLPTGDLHGYLAKNADLVSWSKEKKGIAIGVARALEFLHSQAPPLIHRDLKSKNILLTRQLEPKLIDFGVSRGREEFSMTAGVGTPYWTAPEILEGKRYTEQADIYSFRVVLTEIDTGKLPYHDALTPEGTTPKPFMILADLPSISSNFAFDGTNSDLAKQLYFRAKAGDKAKQFDKFDVPDTLQTRLDELKLDWYKLPGIAQRALLWDSGFGISPNNKPVKIWTLNGDSMADLAVSKRQYEDVNCTVKVCLQPDNKTSYANEKCLGGDMLKAARCVVEDFVDETGIHAAMWVTGGNPVVIPTPRVNKHAWTDQNDQKDYVVFAVHTIHLDYEPAWDFCPTPKQNDGEFLVGKRLSYDSIIFKRPLSKGANGEVWQCDYQNEEVAVKRLLQHQNHHADEVEEFAQEIELSASLKHPNIVEFIGVAWSSLNNLVMALEYFPMGDLQSYLQRNGDLMSWPRDKIHIAVGTATALQYLHSRTPPLIHRDLKSKNILLTRTLEAKLIDFGVSRARQEYSMTAGVGTPYWTAPEILEGKRYTEQADLYSFGVVLSELDTCKLPYHDALTPDGNKPKPVQILADTKNRRHLAGSGRYQDAELPSDAGSFAFDGTNSDLARQLYFRAKAGASASQLNNLKAPSAVQDRLDELVLDWDKLPGIAQRALLWDSGFGLTASDAPVKIWTLNKHSIADLAVPLDQFLVVGCEEKACVQPDNTTSYSNEWCGGAQMLQAARCVVEDFVDSSDIHAAMWVTGGNPLVVPTPHILKHEWKDQRDKNSYIVFAIHTLDLDDEPAWNTCPDPAQNDGYGSLVLPLTNLVMIMEFLPLGDLQAYLRKNFDLLVWTKDKIHIAIGVALALEYLHSRSPPIIHRDLKSKNILISKRLEPKLSDFGVSRSRQENSMTAGVGTPYWSAPEILEGKRYTEQADMYSLGVVLSELDTGKLPYHDALTPEGKSQKPFTILAEIDDQPQLK